MFTLWFNCVSLLRSAVGLNLQKGRNENLCMCEVSAQRLLLELYRDDFLLGNSVVAFHPGNGLAHAGFRREREQKPLPRKDEGGQNASSDGGNQPAF